MIQVIKLRIETAAGVEAVRAGFPFFHRAMIYVWRIAVLPEMPCRSFLPLACRRLCPSGLCSATCEGPEVKKKGFAIVVFYKKHGLGRFVIRVICHKTRSRSTTGAAPADDP